MKRQILGILAASIAASYLAPFLMLLFDSISTPTGIPERAAILNACLFGLFAIMVFGLPLLLIGSLIAVLLHRFAIHSKWSLILGGAVLGLCLTFAVEPVSLSMLIFLLREEPGSRHFFLAAILAGTLYGWIYWVIAIRRTPDDACAIDAA
jgi:hypothetical protein